MVISRLSVHGSGACSPIEADGSGVVTRARGSTLRRPCTPDIQVRLRVSCVNKLAGSSCAAARSLAGRPVALASLGEALELPCVHVAHPFPAMLGRWADPRVVGNTAVTQGIHVRAVLFDPCA